MITLAHHELKDMMRLPLPTKTRQKRLEFRPSEQDIIHVYTQINQYVFDNELKMPKFRIGPRCRKYWGMCLGNNDIYDTGSFCEIKLMDKWFCAQWTVTILAHEMAHQHQWDIESVYRNNKGMDSIMSHGPSFFRFRDKLALYSMPLRTAHSQRKWFKYQDLTKC